MHLHRKVEKLQMISHSDTEITKKITLDKSVTLPNVPTCWQGPGYGGGGPGYGGGGGGARPILLTPTPACCMTGPPGTTETTLAGTSRTPAGTIRICTRCC